MQDEEAKTKFIINGCRNGSRKAQEMLYRHYFSYGMNVALRYGRDRQEAEDIMQEGFFKAFKGIDSYDDALPFKTWLRRVLVNAAIDYLRRHKMRFSELDGASFAGEEVVNDGLEKLKYAELIAAIHQLSPAYRLVFNLYAIEGYRHREIAEKLSITEGTSKSNYAKARRKLQDYLLRREGKKKSGYEAKLL